MHDLLVSYLLDEVSSDERLLVERRLREDPEIRRQLEHLRHCMGLDEAAPLTEPPADLAERTSERVAIVADSGEFDRDGAAYSSLGFTSNSFSDGESSASWTVVDLTVAAGVVLAIGMLLLPALHDSRSASRRLECQDNLRQLGVALASFSNDHHRYMPPRRNEHAGMFAIYLVDGGYLDANAAPHLLVCPSSPMAEEIRAGRLSFHIPSLDEFHASRGQQRLFFIRTSGGSYAYRLGYRQNGNYQALRNTYCPRVPILADLPIDDPEKLNPSDAPAGNHGGCGENLLYQDQSVKYLVGVVAGDDHLYLNHDGKVAPSYDPADTVLARSDVQPQILPRDKVHGVRIQLVPFRSR